MGWTRKWVNVSGSTADIPAVTDASTLVVVSTGAAYGYTGSVRLTVGGGVCSDSDNAELDFAASARTLDKYLDGQKVYFPGKSGYLGSFGATGYTGSVGAVGYKGSAAV